MKYIIYSFLLLAGATMVNSCKKDDSQAGTTFTTYKINYSGVRLAGDTLTFSCSTAGSSYLWNFGDNTGTSTQASPIHIYSDTGTYIVRLILTGSRNMELRKTVNVVENPGTTYLIAGTRTFHHTFNSSNMPDTIMSIIYLDPLDVQIGADTIPFSSNNGYQLTFNQTYPLKINSTFQLTLTYYELGSNNISLTKATAFNDAGSIQLNNDYYFYP